MNKPFVTIIVCAYNRGNLIIPCIKSLLNQSYPARLIEIIVVNDGSTDNTRDVVSELPVKLINHSSNQGIPKSRNTGIKNAKGDIIIFTDDDCIADVNWISELVKCYSNEKIIAVGGFTKAMSNKTLTELYLTELGYGNPAPLDFGKSNNPLYRFYIYIKEMLNTSIIQKGVYEVQEIYTLNASYTKEAIDAVNGFDESLSSNEDVDICTRMRKKLNNAIILCNSEALIFHKHRSNLRSFLMQAYYRSANTMRYYLKHRKVPPIFPLPIISITLIFIILLLFPIELYIFTLLIILLVYPWWIKKSFNSKNIKMLLLAYVQFIHEITIILGMMIGFVKDRKY